MADLGASIAFLGGFYLFASGISLVMYVLQGIGIYKMGKNMGLSNPWISFIPVVNVYALGRIAQKYIKNDGKLSAKFGKILLILSIIMMVILVLFITFVLVLVIMEAISDPTVNSFFESGQMAVMSAFVIVLPLILGYFVILGLAIAYQVVYYIALWRLFAIYDNNNATLYLVLSIIFKFMAPIFIFILRNREPKLTIAERINVM